MFQLLSPPARMCSATTQVREQQKQREQEALQAKALAAQRDELRRQRKQQEAATQAAAAQRLMQASVWGGLVRAVHTTQLLVRAAMALNRQEETGTKEQACITIQRFWRVRGALAYPL